MGHTGVVRRVRLETDGEDIVAVVTRDVQVVGAGLVVLKVQSRQFQFRHVLRPQQRKAVKLITRLGILRELSDGLLGRVDSIPQHVDGFGVGSSWSHVPKEGDAL